MKPRKPKPPKAPQSSLCVECGPNVLVDEDGCCAACGTNAMGPWADVAAQAIGAHKQQQRLNRAARAWAKMHDELPSGWIHDRTDVELVRAVRAFERASK